MTTWGNLDGTLKITCSRRSRSLQMTYPKDSLRNDNRMGGSGARENRMNGRFPYDFLLSIEKTSSAPEAGLAASLYYTEEIPSLTSQKLALLTVP